MGTALLAWLAAPSAQRSIRFARDDGDWEVWTYERLAARVAGTVELLISEGVPNDAVVSLVLPSGPDFVATFFAVLALGAAPAPIAPPTALDDQHAYVRRTAALMSAAGGVVITNQALSAQVKRAADAARLTRPPLVIGAIPHAPGPIRTHDPDIALVQFTSGSSRAPRGVVVTAKNLKKTLELIVAWVGLERDCAGAHWLPLHHDMGLIGGILTPVCMQRDVWVLRPDQFIRNPMRWLERFGRGEAVIGVAPSFGFSYAASRIAEEDLAGCDFSRWKAAVVGAERVDPAALERFSRLLRPYGFRPTAFLPGYGLAEATLAVTGVPREQTPRVVRLDWTHLRFGGRVRVEEMTELGQHRDTEEAGWLSGSGQVLDSIDLKIVDEAGAELPPGHLGEIEVRGPTVTPGYLNDTRNDDTNGDPRIRTGDAGFLLEGELFVTGRVGDALKVRGRMIHAEDLESRLDMIKGIRRGRSAVVTGIVEGRPSVVAIVQEKPGPWVSEACRVLQREVADAAEIRVITGGPGAIMRTTSGKPRRRMMWHAVLEGRLKGDLVAEMRCGRPSSAIHGANVPAR